MLLLLLLLLPLLLLLLLLPQIGDEAAFCCSRLAWA